MTLFIHLENVLTSHVPFIDSLIIGGVRLFVFMASTVILLAEIVSGGVGTFALFNLLTGIPLSSAGSKGFSENVLSGMFQAQSIKFTKAIPIL